MNESWGFSSIEALLSSAILILIVTTFMGAYIYGSESTALAGQRARATFLAEEGLEASRNIRDENFSNLTNGTKGLAISGNQWTFSGTSDATDSFYTRQITISAIDSQRKGITSNVSWQQNSQRTGANSFESRLTNWKRDFGNWTSASVEATINLSGNADNNGVAIYKTSTNTYAVIVRSSSADPELNIYDITNPATPTSVGSLEIGSDCFDVVVSGNYALIATADDAQELKVVSLSVPASPALVGNFNAAGNANANTVVASGNTVFIGRNQSTDPEIYAISISTPAVPTQLGSLNTTNTITDLALGQSDQYLYASSIDNAGELVTISVASPGSMSVSSTYDSSGNFDGTGVTAFSTYALLGRASGEVNVIQLAIPSSPTLISSSLSLSSQVNDFFMGVGDLYSFAGINSGAAGVQIVDLSNLAAPTSIASVASTANINGLTYDFDLNRVVAASSSNSNEVYIIKPN